MIFVSNMLSFTLNIHFKLVACLLYTNISMSNPEHPAILIIYNCGLEKWPYYPQILFLLINIITKVGTPLVPLLNHRKTYFGIHFLSCLPALCFVAVIGYYLLDQQEN